jgi:hypothetical protein
LKTKHIYFKQNSLATMPPRIAATLRAGGGSIAMG